VHELTVYWLPNWLRVTRPTGASESVAIHARALLVGREIGWDTRWEAELSRAERSARQDMRMGPLRKQNASKIGPAWPGTGNR
jgi:hypothetical protein